MKVDTDSLRKAAEAATKTLGLTSIKLEIVTKDFNECANPRVVIALLDERVRLRAVLQAFIDRDVRLVSGHPCCACGAWCDVREKMRHGYSCLIPAAEEALRKGDLNA